MNLTFNRLLSRISSNKGYTIDQTILIVAIIAILITLVIITVGWQLINRSSGTKAGAQLKQVEDANGQFYSGQHVWPQNALTTAGTPATTMAVLVNQTIPAASWAANIDQSNLRNILPGFRISGTGTSAVVYHGFGSGTSTANTITEQVNTMATAGPDQRLVVQFANMPLADAQEADKAIDGSIDATKGRVIYGTSACLNTTSGGASTIPSAQPTASLVTLCYAANTIN
jgi:Tfp pilus assembly protein PilE